MTTAPAVSSQCRPAPRDRSDGITLAVHAYTEIDPQRPTVLAIHGYPDNHHLWDGVAEHFGELRRQIQLRRVRRARGRRIRARRPAPDYRFSQLVSDIGAVIDSLGVGRSICWLTTGARSRPGPRSPTTR